jgi:hypothetical protein
MNSPKAAAAVLFIAVTFAACGRAPREDPKKIAALEAIYETLHDRLEKAAAKDPAVNSALSEDGQLVMGIRSGLIEEIAGNLSRRYLDTVQVDLGEVHGKGGGEIRRKTFLGNVKVGDWKVNVQLDDLVGRIRVGWPRVSLRSPNLIDVHIPVQAQETEGGARLDFAWDSAGVANVVCRDFDLSRDIRGRVIKQEHAIEGSLRLENTGENLVATPLVPDRSVQLAIDLTPQSWEIVEAALQEQNTFGKCGTLIKPAVAIGFLKDLAKRGINVKLPRSIFRTVKFPGTLQKKVRVHESKIGIEIKAERLRIETATLWSSASVQVLGKVQPTPEP